MVMKAGSHAGCCCCNFPDSAAAAVLMQCSHMREQGGWLPEDRWRMMGGAHMMGCEEQLWTHTYMVMVGTSNHSDAAMRSSAVIITIIIIARTAVITLRPTPAPIWREADIAHVSRSDEEVSNVVEEAHEAVEPTTMTSDGATPTATADGWLHLDELALCISPISSSSSSSSLVPNSSGCCRGCGGCDVRRCAVASRDDAAAGGRWPFSSQAPPPMTRAGRYMHTQMCEKRRRKADVCGFPQPIILPLFPTNHLCS
ncbi:hypothetical protein PTSG_09989, partial [Salpingoeca rosetta]